MSHKPESMSRTLSTEPPFSMAEMQKALALAEHMCRDSMLRRKQHFQEPADASSRNKLNKCAFSSLPGSPLISRRTHSPKPAENAAAAADGKVQQQEPVLAVSKFGGKLMKSGQYVPPKQLLLYIVKMGSFTLTKKIPREDTQDDEIIEELATISGIEDLRTFLIQRCRQKLAAWPALLARKWISANFMQGKSRKQKSDPVSAGVSGNPEETGFSFRVIQWNLLSQALGTARDSFAMCPPEALDWEHRRHRLLEEILVHDGDILCFQEVDHFNFLAKHLERLGYKGSFVPKPDSPCIYIPENNGPDGCAIFYRTSKFELISEHTRVIEVWGVQSNQVIMATTLRCIPTSREICVATTHLKAKDGALLATIRHQEGLDVLSFLRQVADGRPIIVTGDFNAAPTEPVYAVMTGTSLRSAYATCTGSEPDYTTWKVRESSMAENAEHEETVSTLDYVFHSKRSLQVDAVLGFPAGEEMGPERLPSLKYASDHLSLACDFRLSTRGHSDELDDEVNDDEEGSENPEAGPGQFVPPYSAFKRQQSRQ